MAGYRSPETGCKMQGKRQVARFDSSEPTDQGTLDHIYSCPQTGSSLKTRLRSTQEATKSRQTKKRNKHCRKQSIQYLHTIAFSFGSQSLKSPTKHRTVEISKKKASWLQNRGPRGLKATQLGRAHPQKRRPVRMAIYTGLKT